MDEDWVKEHGVTRGHLKVDSRVAGVIVLHTMIAFVHTTLQRVREGGRWRERIIHRSHSRKMHSSPVRFYLLCHDDPLPTHLPSRIFMLKQCSHMCTRKDH